MRRLVVVVWLDSWLQVGFPLQVGFNCCHSQFSRDFILFSDGFLWVFLGFS